MPHTRPAAVVRRLATAAADPPADRQLLRAFVASHSEPAFAEIVRRHGPTVLGVCRRVLGCAHDADDAFQATFLVLARRAGSVQSGNLAGWLYGVAVRTARGVRLMRDRRQKRESMASGGRESAVLNGRDRPEQDELAAVIDEELARLPECYRAAVVLCELQGRPRKEAAAELGIPEGTLSSRLAAARRKLAEQLTRRGITAPTAALSAVLAPTASAQLPHGPASAVAAHAADVVVKALFAAQLKGFVLAVGVAVGLVGGGIAMTGGPGGEPPAAPAPREAADAAAAVRQLGSADFATREAAEKKLRAMGQAAIPAVAAGTRDADPEVSRRSRAVLDQIRTDARADLVRRFDPAGTADYDHPVWRRFQKVAGNDRSARKLFAAVIADPRRLQLLDAAEASPDDAGRLYAAELARQVGALKQGYKEAEAKAQGRTGPVVPSSGLPTREEFAALLLLGTHPATARETYKHADDGDRVSHHNLFGFGLRPPSGKKQPAAPPEVRRLFAAWLANRADPDIRREGLWLATSHDMAEALPAARAAAADKTLAPRAKGFSLLAVGHLGTKADLPLVGQSLADDGVVWTSRYTDGMGGVKPIELRVRDTALAAALHLHGQDPADYGFPLLELFGLRQEPAVLKRYELLGFFDADGRAAAHKKALAWLTEQPKDAGRPDPPAKFWPHFAKAVGSDRLSQELFDLIAADKPTVALLEKAAAGDRDLRKLYLARRDELNAAAKRKHPTQPSITESVPVPLPAVAGWLLLGTYPGTRGDDPNGPPVTFLDAEFGQKPLGDALEKGERGPPLRKLLAAWLANRGDEYSALKAGLTLAVRYDVRDALPTGRRVVKDYADPLFEKAGFDARGYPVLRAWGAMVVGKYGTKADAALLAPLVTDDGRVSAYIREKPGRERPGYAVPIEGQDITTQVRDVAVAMMLHLHGEHPRDWDFLWPTKVDGVPFADPFALTQIGFLSQRDRDAAHQKARAWLDEQKKP